VVLPAPAAAYVTPAPSPSPAGPCAQGALASIVDRPGVGRAVAVNGSPCVVPRGRVVVEAGGREQLTTAPDGTSRLVTAPDPLVRIGIGDRDEIVVSPTLIFSWRGGANLGAPFVPAFGMQDAGFGFKRELDDRPDMQDAIEAFVTVPTGFPRGPTGFSAGTTTELVGYSIVIPLSATVGLTSTQNVVRGSAPNAAGVTTAFTAYQPSLGVSYALGARATVLVQDQITTPLAPGAGTGNRALLGFQEVVAPNIVVDAEYELNALPPANAHQRAVGIGVAVRI
jgi:hypothetical protein